MGWQRYFWKHLLYIQVNDVLYYKQILVISSLFIGKSCSLYSYFCVYVTSFAQSWTASVVTLSDQSDAELLSLSDNWIMRKTGQLLYWEVVDFIKEGSKK
jgi:hypothetical protein